MFGHSSHSIKIDYLAYPLVVRKPLRRQSERFKLYAPARMFINGIEQKKIVLKDVSCRGIRLTCSVPLKVHDKLEIQIDKPTVNEPVKIKSQVIWCTSKEVGEFEAGVSAESIDLDNFKEKILAHAEIGITTARGSFRKKIDIDLMGLALAASFMVLVVFGVLQIRQVREQVDQKMLALHKAVGYHVEGVIYDPEGKSMVTINDQVVREGETFRNLKVEKINRDSVVVSLGDQRKVLTFNKLE